MLVRGGKHGFLCNVTVARLQRRIVKGATPACVWDKVCNEEDLQRLAIGLWRRPCIYEIKENPVSAPGPAIGLISANFGTKSR
ncbi:hypothetical protein CCM_00546 [Cordyceps militaris CM01]|uniref:Uncharacterized protein n=1 Tax=Cordyceps militaris (strain CM01) TaxID=983644 RepID=G3J4M2_CORMM|nr:uncharacterized protein CCM_00546 [Cordyceps militaris CM01]EGX95892.1 hypothetical protein CCM_00546 [Cordyceps militaris CM01]